MTDPSANALRVILGDSLQGGALRVVLILGAISAVGAAIAWLVI